MRSGDPGRIFYAGIDAKDFPVQQQRVLYARSGKAVSLRTACPISSLEKQIAIHTKKLGAYKADPSKFDNMGHLKLAVET
ncbi:hypothetical protein [Chitinophaga alhagiae]|uniref:hypothetical protein n=1 Tax=Chitinophaga alhagiae TaxID=2203219 RepID=UPI000E5B67D0|nr:hypothetical protein [Chitinophaga alhagiae]